jgi:hypothetical protein
MLNTMSTKQHMPTGSFILEWWSQILDLPRYISPHWWLGRMAPRVRRSYRFVDCWVIGHFLGSIFLFLVTAAEGLWWVEWLAVRYGALILIEGFCYEVNVLVFSGYRAAKNGRWQRVLSHRRLVITSLQNYVAIIFRLALFYRHWFAGFTPAPSVPNTPSIATHPWLTWLALSFHTMTGFGDAPVAPTETRTILLTLAQSSIGVFMALLIVVSFVRLLPEPGSKTRFEQQPPPYYPTYDPSARSKERHSGRSPAMSSISKESLALCAAIGGFLIAALSLLLGYSLFSALTVEAGWAAEVNCCVGAGLVVFGVVATLLAAGWLVVNSWRKKPS